MKYKLQPLVSIVIPTYNGEAFLKETIESVLNQTYANFELIISDDNSDDSSKIISMAYAKNYSKVKFIKADKRGGIGANWNRGLREVNGRYIKLMGQDDLLKQNCIEENVRTFEKYKTVSLVTSHRELFGKLHEIRGEKYFPLSGFINGSEAQNNILKNGNWIGGPTATFFKKKDLYKIGFFDEKIPCGLDWEMWLRLLGCGSLYVIPKILFATRIHTGQETNSCRKKLGFKKDFISIIQKILDNPALYSIDVSKGQLRLIQRREMQRLLLSSLKSKHISVRESIIFISKFQTALQTLFIAIKTTLINIYLTTFRLKSENHK